MLRDTTAMMVPSTSSYSCSSVESSRLEGREEPSDLSGGDTSPIPASSRPCERPSDDARPLPGGRRRRNPSRWKHLHWPLGSPHSATLLLSLLLLLASATGAIRQQRQSSPLQQDPSILAIFRHQHEGKDIELEKMIMDHSTNRLYVGGVNHLFDINPDVLSVREHAVTGPKPDSVLCAGGSLRLAPTMFLYSLKTPFPPLASQIAPPDSR